MTDARHRGDRAGHGAVPPLLLVLVGLLVAVVAGVFLVLQLQGGQADTLAVSTPTPTAASAPSPEAAAVTTTEPTSAATTEAGEPAWIRIASGGVDGPIVPQGLAADGTINPGRDEIIWFTGNDRVAPGEVGTAVIAAHVTWEGRPDAFVDLPSVSLGDEVEVGYDDGTVRTFTVTEAVPVGKEQLARSLTVWGEHPDRPRLAIITCDETQGVLPDGHTAANFVVIAEA